MKYCETNLPKYLVPDEIEFYDKFERNCIGIIKKSSLHLMNK
jgi:non-ribosomal peptide synthetase component E (peptide arylation enzyme)